MSLPKEDQYDVVVVGSGAAGFSAGLTAVQGGSKTMVLEKGRATGGSSNYTEGLFAVNSSLQKAKGIKVSGTEVLKEEVEYSQYKADARIWRNYVDGSAENVDWLQEQGVEFERVQAMGAGEATWHIYKGMGDAVIHQALQPRFEAVGGEVVTSAAAVNLVRQADQTFVVTVRDEANQDVKAVHARAVILATGGYLNNPEMMAEETNYDLSRLETVSSGKGTGDGLRMAWQVGARKYGTGMAMLFGGYLSDPETPSFKFMSSQMNVAAGQQLLLWVNENGERFVNEEVVYNFSQAGNALYTQAEVYSILDQGVIDKMITEGNFMGLGVYVLRGQKMDTLQEEIDAAVAADKTFIFKADSIEELAKKMGLAQLPATISRYNRDAAQGEDREFGKPVEYMQPVTQGPFYGFKLNIGAFCTMGGLQVTPQNEVRDEQGQVIPGLYAVGNDAAGLTGDTYGPNMPGTCVGYAIYSGRNAGQQVTEYLR